VLEWVTFTLRAWAQEGSDVQPSEFVERLVIVPRDSIVVEETVGVARVRLLGIATSDFAHVDTTEDAGAQSEAFAKAIQAGLVRAAEWLSLQSPELFLELRASRRFTDIFVSGWISGDQFDLDLPPEFLQASGTLGLTVSICTND
jgi:hypothetical protein